MVCSKYRNFLPQEYVEKENKSRGKSLRRAIYYLIIVNVLILPINIKDNHKTKPEVDSTNLKDNYNNNIENLLGWLDIDTNIIKSIKVDNDNGEVIIDKKENAYYLESIGFVIDEVIHDGDDIILKIRSGNDIN